MTWSRLYVSMIHTTQLLFEWSSSITVIYTHLHEGHARGTATRCQIYPVVAHDCLVYHWLEFERLRAAVVLQKWSVDKKIENWLAYGLSNVQPHSLDLKSAVILSWVRLRLLITLNLSLSSNKLISNFASISEPVLLCRWGALRKSTLLIIKQWLCAVCALTYLPPISVKCSDDLDSTWQPCSRQADVNCSNKFS